MSTQTKFVTWEGDVVADIFRAYTGANPRRVHRAPVLSRPTLTLAVWGPDDNACGINRHVALFEANNLMPVWHCLHYQDAFCGVEFATIRRATQASREASIVMREIQLRLSESELFGGDILFEHEPMSFTVGPYWRQ